MAREVIEKCNRCGKPRNFNNNWWILIPAAGGGVTIQTIGENDPTHDSEIYCSESCLLARVSEIISVIGPPESEAA